MKRIAVTGGSGRLGLKVIDLLLREGFQVVALDLRRPAHIPCSFLTVDLVEAAAVTDAMNGCDAVIHLGAIPGPTSHPQSVTFSNNVSSTWNVANAAALHGMQKVVFASSVFTLGWHESPERYWPKYAPVDEEHPTTPLEAYGLSKVVGEEILAMFSRQTGIPSISLRIMNVIQEEAWSALPWLAPTKDQPIRFLLWPYVHVRDAAMSCVQALTAEVRGHESLFIAANEIRFRASTQELLAEFAPDVEIRQPLEGAATVISSDKAKRMIGYEPTFSWQNADH